MNGTKHIVVVTRYSAIAERWSLHPGKTFDEAVEWAKTQVADRKGSAPGFDVIEVTEEKRVRVEARIETVDVTEVAAS